jgi:hypothetical protein
MRYCTRLRAPRSSAPSPPPIVAGCCDTRIASDPARLPTSTRRFQKPKCIFLLTFIANNLIYESHCDFFYVAKFDVRENHSMKSATKKPAKKKAAPKKKK